MNDIFTLLFLAVGLSMDAFAVSICKGLGMDRITLPKALIVGLWFGIFQGIMPIIGYYLGQSFVSYITKADHWIAFGLLALIGGNMIREALEQRSELRSGKHQGEQEKESNPLAFRTMLVMAIATSIDALAVGLSMAMTEGEGGFNIWTSAGVIAIVTCLISMAGVKVGALFGHKYEYKAEFVGGVILIAIGVRVLVEHLGIATL